MQSYCWYSCKSASYPKFYGIDNNVTIYNNGEEISYEDTNIDTLSSIILGYNSREKWLRIWCITKQNDKYLKTISNIDHGNYQLALYINGKGTKLQIKEYFNTMPDISV